MKITILFLVFAITSYEVACIGLTEVFGWRQIEYEYGPVGDMDNSAGRFHCESCYFRIYVKFLFIGVITFPGATNQMKKRGAAGQSSTPPDVEYTAYNNVPMGATHHKGRLFITMPRRRTGIPSTLNYIDMNKAAGNPSPRLRAYPNLEVNTLNVSV